MPPEGPDTAAPGNIHEYSVSEISGAVKRMVEDQFGYVRVRGEIGRVSRPQSGHVYLDMKDERAVLSGVIWKGVAAGLRVKPEQGLEVIATGRLTTFPGQSKYQIVIEALEPAGLGALMALLEERRKKLAAEGLFDAERKKELPYLPGVIGVVTSPSGAVIRDILHRLSDRFPRHVLVWPVRVQGEGAAAEVANGIRGFNALQPGGAIPRPDLLIVARGGGSIEDLWPFNEEVVVRAAAESAIPLISAVGHETDTTLIDFASDKRAPTPTAAAEMAVPVRAELLTRVVEADRRQLRALTRRLEDGRTHLRSAARALPRLDRLLDGPRQRLDNAGRNIDAVLIRMVERRRSRFDVLAGRMQAIRPATRVTRAGEQMAAAQRRLDLAFRARADRARARLDQASRLLVSLSYEGVLERGFALARNADGSPIRSGEAARAAQNFDLEFAHGDRVGVAVRGEGDAPPPAAARPAKKLPAKKPAAEKPAAKPRPKSRPGQGELF